MVSLAMDTSLQLISLPASLEDVRIRSLPSGAFYIADFITEEEEAILLNKVSCLHAFWWSTADLEDRNSP
jgi:hypothetical protein